MNKNLKLEFLPIKYLINKIQNLKFPSSTNHTSKEISQQMNVFMRKNAAKKKPMILPNRIQIARVHNFYCKNKQITQKRLKIYHKTHNCLWILQKWRIPKRGR